MIRYLFYGLVVYFLYKLVFELILPVGKVAKQMKTKMNEMNTQNPHQNTNNTSTATQKKEGDYIDFEEIK